MARFSLKALGWRPRNSDKDFSTTRNLGEESHVSLVSPSENEPGDTVTNVSALLIIHDRDASREIFNLWMDNELYPEWKFWVEEERPFEVPLGFSLIDDHHSGRIELFRQVTDEDIATLRRKHR